MEAKENEKLPNSASSNIPKTVPDTRQRDALQQAVQEIISSKEELEQKSQELTNLLAIMRGTFDSTSDGILVTDGRGKIIDYNKKYVSMFGIPQAIMDRGDNIERREFVSKLFSDPQKFIERIKEIVGTGVPESSDELEFTDGRVFERYSKLLDVDNPDLGRVWSFHDITKQKEQEKKEREAKIYAEKRSKSSEDFMALLSHEMRTPLTPVLLTATALKDDERLPQDVREQFAMMERNIALEVRMIDDLLDITSISVKKFRLNPQPSDAHSLIELAIGIVSEGAKSKEISIERKLTAKRSGIMTDPVRFQQIIWNLLRNSIKFTPNGGQITVLTHDGDEGWLHIEVTDTGIGMEPEDIKKIFLPLEQLSVARERKFGGLGLGLAIARSIVELHGGRITAHSEGIDRGTTFTIEFPGATKPANGIVNTTAGSTASLPADMHLRLLLVDDHPSTLYAVSTLLTRDGHKVVTASTMADALAAAETNTFDIVISDLGLPDGTGNDLMAKLRDNYGLRGIAMSGYGTEDDIVRSLEAGFGMYLIKPVPFSELRRVLAQMGSA